MKTHEKEGVDTDLLCDFLEFLSVWPVHWGHYMLGQVLAAIFLHLSNRSLSPTTLKEELPKTVLSMKGYLLSGSQFI